MTVSVVQLGARMHYAVPRILNQADLLYRLYSDCVAGKGISRLLAWMPESTKPRAVRKLLERIPVGIPGSMVTSFDSVGLTYAWALRRAKNPSELARAHISAGNFLADRVLRVGLGEAAAVFAFNSAALRLFQGARRLGLRTIYEQSSAPVAIEWPLVRDEFLEWPAWESFQNVDDFYRPFADIQEAEWELADLIVCASQFVMEGIRKTASITRHIEYIPYGVPECREIVAGEKRLGGRRLRVLTVGNLRLLKGAPYVRAAAEALRGRAEFRWVGPSSLTEKAMREMSRYVTLVGPVPRSEVKEHYRWADVFLLPSICEGSATVTYEAMQHGLPLVVTQNTGAPLPSDSPSFIPIRSVEAIVDAMDRFIDDPDELMRRSLDSLALAPSLTIDAYGERLLKVIADCNIIS